MKKSNLKKVFAIIAALVMVFSLTACGGSGDADAYKVAVVKQMDHASMDEIATAICEQLDRIEKEKGVKIEYEV